MVYCIYTKQTLWLVYITVFVCVLNIMKHEHIIYLYGRSIATGNYFIIDVDYCFLCLISCVYVAGATKDSVVQ